MKIKELLSDSSKWIQGDYAVDKENIPVAPKHAEACKWCLIGAVFYCYVENPRARTNAMLKIGALLPGEFDSIPAFNDASVTKFEDIQKLLQEADV